MMDVRGSILSFFLLLVINVTIATGCQTALQTEDVSGFGEHNSDNIRPNILLIVADDLGYTDLGAFGGEISTPNLDELARNGLILTDFHTQAVCAPTRASLLSGLDNHRAGGAMHVYDEQRGMEAYQEGLRRDVVTFPAILAANGYHTYFAGKWHLGTEPDRLPTARGFARAFALKEGGASHYSDMRGMFENERVAHYFKDGKAVETLPKDFYSSKAYTDFILEALKEDEASGAPWFAELAFTAPHWPLQAPEEYIDKYKGQYDAGYEVLRQKRIDRAKMLGTIPADAPIYPMPSEAVPWDALSPEEQVVSSRTMEVYAAMVEALDANVGRLITYLKETGQFENTLIIFISDNGAEGQNRPPGDNGADWTFDNSLENIGHRNSHVYTGPAWASVSVGLMRYYKSLSSEGGVRTPAFIHHPALSKKGEISGAFASVIDIAPTILELTGAKFGKQIDGVRVQSFQGRSMLPLLFSDSASYYPEDFTFGWEVFGHLAIRRGDWKLLMLVTSPAEVNQMPPPNADQWALYNLRDDPGEVNDLSDVHPNIVAELLAAWDDYVAANGIILPDTHPAQTGSRG